MDLPAGAVHERIGAHRGARRRQRDGSGDPRASVLLGSASDHRGPSPRLGADSGGPDESPRTVGPRRGSTHPGARRDGGAQCRAASAGRGVPLRGACVRRRPGGRVQLDERARPGRVEGAFRSTGCGRTSFSRAAARADCWMVAMHRHPTDDDLWSVRGRCDRTPPATGSSDRLPSLPRRADRPSTARAR